MNYSQTCFGRPPIH